mmetsp:Transcript_90398/g.264518  ORF Transcript_90398/g.264518 Transcript_90398/m.264518 type:complete len:348 (+) Transcript_90398:328-1371(+)
MVLEPEVLASHSRAATHGCPELLVSPRVRLRGTAGQQEDWVQQGLATTQGVPRRRRVEPRQAVQDLLPRPLAVGCDVRTAIQRHGEGSDGHPGCPEVLDGGGHLQGLQMLSGQLLSNVCLWQCPAILGDVPRRSCRRPWPITSTSWRVRLPVHRCKGVKADAEEVPDPKVGVDAAGEQCRRQDEQSQAPPVLQVPRVRQGHQGHGDQHGPSQKVELHGGLPEGVQGHGLVRQAAGGRRRAARPAGRLLAAREEPRLGAAAAGGQVLQHRVEGVLQHVDRDGEEGRAGHGAGPRVGKGQVHNHEARAQRPRAVQEPRAAAVEAHGEAPEEVAATPKPWPLLLHPLAHS